MQRIFISSVQKEFAGERRALRDYIHGDPMLRRFFEVFLFEDLPASDQRADAVYLDEFTGEVAGEVTGEVTSRTPPPFTGQVGGQVAGQVTGQVEVQDAQSNEVFAA